jgi:hypothetical protein
MALSDPKMLSRFAISKVRKRMAITLAIFGIVWQSAKSVLTCMLDGVEPGLIDEIHHTAEHVEGATVVDAKARWIGHKLHADVAIRIDDKVPLSAANKLAASVENELFDHMPALAVATSGSRGKTRRTTTVAHDHTHGHHHITEGIAE